LKPYRFILNVILNIVGIRLIEVMFYWKFEYLVRLVSEISIIALFGLVDYYEDCNLSPYDNYNFNSKTKLLFEQNKAASE